MEQYGWMGINSLNHSEHMLWILTILTCSHNGIVCNPYGFPGDSVGKEPLPMQETQGHGFNPWVRKIPWRRKWQPFPVFLPGKFHGQRSLAGYSPCGHKELDMTELSLSLSHTHTYTQPLQGRGSSIGIKCQLDKVWALEPDVRSGSDSGSSTY